MSLFSKRIWIDIEQPKTAIMFKSLIKKFEKEGLDLLITARDYDSTYQILDDFGVKYKKIGRHGGEKLEDKLETYITRLKQLFPLIIKFSPDYFVTFLSIFLDSFFTFFFSTTFSSTDSSFKTGSTGLTSCFNAIAKWLNVFAIDL